MLVRVLQAVALLLFPVGAKSLIAQNSSDLKTLAGIDAFMKTYYLHPQPERIADVIDALSPSGFVKPTNESVLIGSVLKGRLPGCTLGLHKKPRSPFQSVLVIQKLDVL
ncbi:MAG: hypothetical protein JO097_05110 [Acidobacteriaceae bacterium]|nr:hypothetical protein [Acidobacteriaceae bacterium]MBV9294927.1 hypothetical protein [Acidobacteriaceae bacterium]MBV9763453.1 hypothetical protein [Acidobacteriaceae bacterium]